MRYRNMYYLTGLPGWMRFGYSPGWVGRSATGLGPCAEYLITGRWPTFQAAPMAQAGAPTGWPGFEPQTRLEFLRKQAEILEQQLATIKSQIENLERAQTK
ncbi:MAG: DUF5320 domain-containing protein [Armatimonadetes bacterium]|nr:DUF5320 domain-containing protein [Armatimonadota bacterium]